jgi:predicted Zn-dependent peptidase
MGVFRHTLSNGIRVVIERIRSVRSVSMGVWVNVGSRDEATDEHGVSHFIEHMFFKGTERRSAKEIAHAVDALGGEMNAFTSRETTTFYVKVLDEQWNRGADILADVFLHSRFASKDIEKEKQIVCEEIRMVEDDPEDLVHDLHMGHVWRKDPLGRTILGTPESVTSITRRNIVAYREKHYRAPNIVIAVAGNIDPKVVARRMERLFGGISSNGSVEPKRPTPLADRGVRIKRKTLEQAHLCIGVPGIASTDERIAAVHLFSILLGESASSRLFQEIRERRGLAYSVYSHVSGFRDTGLFTIYAACRPDLAASVLRFVIRELKRLLRGPLSAQDVRKVKNHLKGGWMLGMESTASRMGKLAKDEIHFGRAVPLREVLAKVDRVSRRDILDTAHHLFDKAPLSLTAVGPLTSKDIPEELFSS